MKRLLILVIFFAFTLKAQMWQTQPEDIVQITLPSQGLQPHQDGSFETTLIFTVQSSWHINSHTPEAGFIPTTLKPKEPEKVKDFKVDYPKGHLKTFSFSQKPLEVYEGEGTLKIKGKLASKTWPFSLPLTFRFQACNDRICLPPMSLEVELPIAQTAQGGEEKVGQWVREKGWFFTLFILVLSGLALNLTPCVYPMIPITLSFFSRQKEKENRKVWALASLYFFGIVMVYSLLGFIAAITGSFFGQALQNPMVLIALALVMVGLALSMFGLYTLRVPAGLASKISGKAGYVGAFFMGGVVGLMAAPCIGPVVLGLLTYVATIGNPLKGFLMFFALAVGLGLPYLFLGFFTSRIQTLPRSGTWMMTVERLFGFLLLAVAVYLLQPILKETMALILWGGLAISFALYLFLSQRHYKAMKFFRIARGLIGIIALAGGIGLMASPWLHKKPHASKNAFSWEALEKAKAKGVPVVIDFYADWCLPCKELEHTTFSHPEVKEALKEVRFLKADLTQAGSKEVKGLIQKFQIRGVPTLVFIKPSGEEAEELRVVGLIGPEEFIQHLKAIGK